MKFDSNRFRLSLCLISHPLLKEKKPIRLKYLNVLADFIEKYANKDVFSQAAFETYKAAFTFDGGEFELTGGGKAIANFKNLLKFRVRNFKFYSFRYVLLCDLIMLICPEDKSKAALITREIKSAVKISKNSVEDLYARLFDGQSSGKAFSLTEYHLECWNKNQCFRQLPEKKIMISSNISSGKSTLINAVVGKRINRSMNEACTAKLHFINDKAFDDNYIYEYDYTLDMNADIATLMENNPKNKSNFVYVASYFHFSGEKKSRLCLIDSPGVNNSLDKTQEKIKRLIVSQDFDMLVYVINGEYIGITDDLTYLQYIQPNLTGRKIVFVINKLDSFRLPEDNIEESVVRIREYLASLGFINPVVCPLSTYAGFLAKRKMYDNDLDEIASDEYALLTKKFNRPEYDLSKFYDDRIRTAAEGYLKNADKKFTDELTLVHKSGMLCFETFLYNGETNI
jgi:GTP-binding protein EngB required for normal cell division